MNVIEKEASSRKPRISEEFQRDAVRLVAEEEKYCLSHELLHDLRTNFPVIGELSGIEGKIA